MQTLRAFLSLDMGKFTRRVLQCLVLIAFTVALLMYGKSQEAKAEYSIVVPTDNSAVMRWLGYFADGELGMCDTLVNNSRDRIYNVSALAIMRDSNYYETVYNRLRESISGISVVETSVDEDYIEYVIEVKYYPYDSISELTYTSSELEDACKEYFDGDSSNTDGFYGVLTSVYYDIFNESCFNQRSDVLEQSKQFVLYQRDDRVYGTVPFLQSMLEYTNINKNLQYYTDYAKSFVNNLIDSY